MHDIVHVLILKLSAIPGELCQNRTIGKKIQNLFFCEAIIYTISVVWLNPNMDPDIKPNWLSGQKKLFEGIFFTWFQFLLYLYLFHWPD